MPYSRIKCDLFSFNASQCLHHKKRYCYFGCSHNNFMNINFKYYQQYLIEIGEVKKDEKNYKYRR